MDTIDNLLAEIQAEYTETKHQPQQQQPTVATAESFIASPCKSDALINNLLAEVKADFLEREAAEELKKQQELEQEKIRQAQLKAQQIETLKKQAQAWLSKLDPFSPEGLWFERFAEAYPSKLDAAIEYLQNN
ncbi:hypothetical protein H6G06_04180 [Anabaena sphaerica FACHB-251]|uniref:Uncharacterized protein n=1 Tax=Anabaena sphaerica FACHB-251 TaxID=2692883 RepID=A0A926ZZR3_9NOST|nr:hypothetical protein [Anabaena sphaerica]MBD2292703.1 hypothetical protein [Anabaena sphaerica FACHB-251]